MAITAADLKALIEQELVQVSDTRVLTQIRGLLVEPKIVLRDWDYGAPGTQYPCWAVLDHSESGTGICYCESGFGPRAPWGLVWLSESSAPQSMGMDSGWYTTFLDTYFESRAPATLPIWCVVKIGPDGREEPITAENSWEATWAAIEALRRSEPGARLGCGHNIVYRRPSVDSVDSV